VTKNKKWRPEPIQKTENKKSGDYSKQNEKINDNFRSNIICFCYSIKLWRELELG
jgi:hypothetical protein